MAPAKFCFPAAAERRTAFRRRCPTAAAGRRSGPRWAVCAGVGAALLASADAEAAAAGRLNVLLEGMQSYAADFEQVVIGADGEALQTVAGAMHVQRPGRFRWEALPPHPQLIVTQGTDLYVFDQDLEQVTVQPVDELLSDSPAQLLVSDGTRLDALFAVRREAVPEALDDAEAFVLEPKDDSSLYRTIRLEFAAGLLRRLDIADHLQQVTRIAFHNARLNPDLPPGLFRFEIPEGVDVVGQPSAASQ